MRFQCLAQKHIKMILLDFKIIPLNIESSIKVVVGAMIHATETGKSIAAQYISIVCPTCFYIFLVNILISSFNI